MKRSKKVAALGLLTAFSFVAAACGSDSGDSTEATTADTTAATTGTAVTAYSTGWNVRAPLEVVFTPEQRIRADQGNTTILLRMGAAPADSLTIGVSVDVEEL